MAIIPTTSVRLKEDVGAVLAAAGGDVDQNDMLTFFTEEAKINMWSKYKPVVVSSANGGDFVDSDLRWKGYDGRCGLTIPTYTSPSSIRTALKNGNALWSYTPPTGGTAQPRRLGDFRSYNSDAVNPVGGMAGSYILRNTNTGYEFDIDIEIVVQASNYNLTLSDITVNSVKLTDMYLGIYLTPVTGSGYYWGGSSTKIGNNGSLSMTATGNSGLTGEFMAYTFLSTASQATSEVDGTFISINKEGQKVQIMSQDTMHIIIVHALWNSSGTSLYYDVYITNNTSSSTTYRNVRILLGRSSKSESDAVENPDDILSWVVKSSYAVSANSDGHFSGSISTSKSSGYFYAVAGMSETPAISAVYQPVDSEAPEE